MNIDTLHLLILLSNIHSSVISHVYEISDFISDEVKNGQKIHKRRYKNLTLYFKAFELVIIGSITKLILGNNQGTLTREECLKGLQRLEEELQVPIFKAYVRRIDFAMNLIVNSPVPIYPQFLNSLPRFSQKHKFSTGLDYVNENYWLSFYDKIKEQRGEPISPVFFGQYVLRYEIRFRNKLAIKQVIGVVNPTLEDILLHFDLIVTFWAKKYQKINKETAVLDFSPGMFQGSKSFKNYLMRRGVEAMGGFSGVEKLIKAANLEGRFKHPSQMSHLKTKLREIVSEGGDEVILNYIKELDEKVDDARLFALSELLPWDHYNIGMNDGVSESLSSKLYQ